MADEVFSTDGENNASPDAGFALFQQFIISTRWQKKQGTEEIRLKHSTSHKTGSIALSNGRERLFACVCVRDMCEGITLMFPKAALQLTISGFLSVQHRAESAVLLCLH